ncbi:MAG: VOC family protein [Bacteroidaceae bacterium]|nr:VOC family protein [Bacteroidaceae bacterium]
MKKILFYLAAIALMTACVNSPKAESENATPEESTEKQTFVPENFPQKGLDVNAFSAGIQHIGLPTADIEGTIRFYEGLGFEVATRADITGRGEFVFVKLGTLFLELIPNDDPAMVNGAVDHFCLDVKNIETLYQQVKDAGYKIITDGIQDIAFWENGARYFFIQGPNNEKIEFCEIL